MDLRKLASHILEQKRQNVIITFEKGQIVRRNHQTFCADVKAACERLRNWGVQPGTRVGIWAHNCYEWIVQDVALLELRALAVAFTDDFSNMSAEQLFDQYSLSLLLVNVSEKKHKSGKYAAAVAFIDAENEGVQAVKRELPAQNDWEFETTGL